METVRFDPARMKNVEKFLIWAGLRDSRLGKRKI